MFWGLLWLCLVRATCIGIACLRYKKGWINRLQIAKIAKQLVWNEPISQIPQGQFPLRQEIRWGLQFSPDASRKFWRFKGGPKMTFHQSFRTVRCTAFRLCITLWGQNWTVWPGEAIFFKKLPSKWLIRAEVNQDSLTSEQHQTHLIKQRQTLVLPPEKFGA